MSLFLNIWRVLKNLHLCFWVFFCFPVAGPSNLVSSQQPSLNVAAVLINERENDHLACSTLLPGSRKRARELGDDDDENALVATTHRQRQQQQPILNAAPAEYHHQQQQQQQTLVHRSPGAAAMSPGPQTIGVSTGLRLAFEQDDSSRLNSTTSASTSTERRAEARTSQSLFYAVGEDLNIQLQQQREEIEQFFKVQVLVQLLEVNIFPPNLTQAELLLHFFLNFATGGLAYL